MRYRLIPLLSALALAGCGTPEQSALDTTEKAVRAQFAQPVALDNLRLVPDAGSSDAYTSATVCGSVKPQGAPAQRFVASATYGRGVVDVSNLQFEGTGNAALAFERVYWRPCA